MYTIVDEPKPGGLSHLACSPVWPLFALMFAGAWLAFPWFVLNSIATGSYNRNKTILLAFAGALGAGLIFLILMFLVENGMLPTAASPYLGVILVLWRLGCGFFIFTGEMQSFHIFEYFGGKAQNGLPFVFLGAILKRKLLAGIEAPFWLVVLG